MKVSLIALAAGCALSMSAFGVLADSIPTAPPHTALNDSIPTAPPHTTLNDSIPTAPPHVALI